VRLTGGTQRKKLAMPKLNIIDGESPADSLTSIALCAPLPYDGDVFTKDITVRLEEPRGSSDAREGVATNGNPL
jgi:hypothetical protein